MKHQKVICQFCEGVTLIYAEGMSNLFNHLKTKHPIARTKTFPKECSTQKQTTLGTFAIPSVLLLKGIESLR